MFKKEMIRMELTRPKLVWRKIGSIVLFSSFRPLTFNPSQVNGTRDTDIDMTVFILQLFSVFVHAFDRSISFQSYSIVVVGGIQISTFSRQTSHLLCAVCESDYRALVHSSSHYERPLGCFRFQIF